MDETFLKEVVKYWQRLYNDNESNYETRYFGGGDVEFVICKSIITVFKVLPRMLTVLYVKRLLIRVNNSAKFN